MNLRSDAEKIIEYSIESVLPDEAVRKALGQIAFGAAQADPKASSADPADMSTAADNGRLLVIAIGKAAWQMARAAQDALGDRISGGIVITKYGHAKGPIGKLTVAEAGHPVPDENTFKYTKLAMDMAGGLSSEDKVLFLVSGGGSALFEFPLVDPAELQDITNQMLAAGMDIVSMNTIRKRLSAVKGGRFARLCDPAKVHSIVLSDILGDPLDMIASGPTAPDSSTCPDAVRIADSFGLILSSEARKLLETNETPKELTNTDYYITGSVSELCKAAAREAERLGYEAEILDDKVCCEAGEAGRRLAAKARGILKANAAQPDCSDSLRATNQTYGKHPLKALIIGGETVVHLTGHGKGGRNQEMALAFAKEIADLDNVLMFSLGSDGTDGPTDAAGGIVDGTTAARLKEKGFNIDQVLADNDSYTALKAVDGLIITGPTGTNVNDVSVVLIKI